MNFRKRGATPAESGFQLAPMIDVIFLLLCFFVASQIFSQWETEVPIELPTAVTGVVPERLPGEIILNILEDGRVVVNGQVLDQKGLTYLLGRLVEFFPGQPILIRADKDTPYEHVIGVLDLCRQSDMMNISFATTASEEEQEET